MDIATLAGLVSTFALIIIGILIGGNSMSLYVDAPSLLIVVGGSFAAMVTASPLDVITKNFMQYCRIVSNLQPNNYEVTITQMVGFAESARKEGLLSLDDAVNDIEDPFLRNGMRMIVDGTDPAIVKKMLYAQQSKTEERHASGAAFFGRWAALGPAFGMIGTLLGLIGLLANLSDAASLGPNMAVALITTLYGSLLANAWLTPFQNKLEDRNSDEMLKYDIMVEGIIGIAGGENPKILETKLYSFLPPSMRPSNLGE
ncbi:MotA/TolQ/ExbB proton channel family protein [Candidatus Haliotispira prima]|uniref:MotA/TolQ/ExbB proton channel family protein n=1 Tax=Candidatus Haliotispira prima TaxID=3034016 RepID=A0ABY8MG54_9SPIO|nr:MotA/TolQ/ExbB proton channel family protein [Candidatus Haliotispira prima]